MRVDKPHLDGVFLHAFPKEAQRSGLLHRKVIGRVWRTLQLKGRAGSWLVLTRRDAGSRAGKTITGTTVMVLLAGTAGLKRHRSVTMEFASRTISPVPY